MAKIEVTSITSGYNVAALNETLQNIEDEFKDKVVYRDEVSPMERALDMNGKDILNVGSIVANSVQVGGAVITEGEFASDSSAVLRGDLAHPTGASLIGSDDGAEGALWTTVAEFIEWVRTGGLEGGVSGVFENLQVGAENTFMGAPYLGTPRIYHETSNTLDQAVLIKSTTGAVPLTALGRTWQAALISQYDGVLASGANPVNVCAANLALTANVGSGFESVARGSVVNQQNVVTVANTDTSQGPNEYANTVFLLDPTLNKPNGGNTMWQNDWTVYGAKDGPDYSLVGTIQMICKWNPLASTSGSASVGMGVNTRPRGGAGAQPRIGLYTFPVDVGFHVSGFSGLNNHTVVNGAYHADATEGFKFGIVVGGKYGPWLNEGIYPNGGSKIGTGALITDFVSTGLHIGTHHPSAVNPISLLTTPDSGVASIGSGAPDFTARLYVNGKIAVSGGQWNAGHLQLGNTHLWVDSANALRTKLGAPTSALDGTLLGGGGGLTESAWVNLPLPRGSVFAGCNPPGYRIVGTTVQLRGGWDLGSGWVPPGGGQPLATLPAGFRPTGTVLTPVAWLGVESGLISCTTAGALHVFLRAGASTTGAAVFLDGCSFTIN